MKETMVSVRMPDSLYKMLLNEVGEAHFLDLSEEIRSIVRKKWLSSARPEGLLIKKLSAEMRHELSKKCELLAQRKMIDELEKMKREISGHAAMTKIGDAR